MAPTAYSDKISPGWNDPGTEPSYAQFKANIDDRILRKGYDDVDCQIAAIRMRLPMSIRETPQKFDPMPTNPDGTPQDIPVVNGGTEVDADGNGGTPWTPWTWFWHRINHEFCRTEVGEQGNLPVGVLPLHPTERHASSRLDHGAPEQV